MSAPRTNIPTQRRWHRAPLIGISVVVVFALGLLFWQMVIVADGSTAGDDPASTPTPDQDDAVPELTPPADPPANPPADPPMTPEGDLPAPATPAPAPDLPAEPLPDTDAPEN